VKVDEKGLASLVPSGATPQPIPPIFTTIDGIIKGINEMLGTYMTMTGKNPTTLIPTGENIMENQTSFHDARAAKKAETTSSTTAEQPKTSDELKELLLYFIKTCSKLEAMGFGSKTVGEAVAEMPFTISQVKEFLVGIAAKRDGN
tara:strand:+ start:150 stop:587 length:438 start_codon:yes stop_codon:yes gene_type:complete